MKQKARMSIGEAFKLMSVNNVLTPGMTAADVTAILPKYLKINRVCTASNKKKCGIPTDKIKAADGRKVDFPSGWGKTRNGGMYSKITGSWSNEKRRLPDAASYFQTTDGFSVALMVNPECGNGYGDLTINNGGKKEYWFDYEGVMDAMCFNAVYDANGSKGPNTVGKDIGFVGGFYNGFGTRAAAALPVEGEDGKGLRMDDQSAHKFCSDKGYGIALPTIDELSLLAANNSLVNNMGSSYFWSRSAAGGSLASKIWLVYFGDPYRYARPASNSYMVRCVWSDELK